MDLTSLALAKKEKWHYLFAHGIDCLHRLNQLFELSPNHFCPFSMHSARARGICVSLQRVCVFRPLFDSSVYVYLVVFQCMGVCTHVLVMNLRKQRVDKRIKQVLLH
jgi:hypothetical protein